MALSEAQRRAPEPDPAWHLLPPEQVDRVFAQDMCDIDPEFLGFTNIYIALASIIPKHWTVIDLGCAYSPQAFVFREHKAYVGVDLYTKERFCAPNSTHYEMTIADFLTDHGGAFDLDRTFAICSYVPPWHGDNIGLVKRHFKNVFTFYPASNPDDAPFFGRAALGEKDSE